MCLKCLNSHLTRGAEEELTGYVLMALQSKRGGQRRERRSRDEDLDEVNLEWTFWVGGKTPDRLLYMLEFKPH